MNNWQAEVGNVIRETYKKEGYSDILIMIGAIAPNNEIHTQIWYPADTFKEFDIRFMIFALLNHLFNEYNQ